MEDIFKKIAATEGKIEIQAPSPGIVVNFRNTSGKWFVLIIEQIIQSLRDIKDNLAAFKGDNAGEYEEKTWRSLLSNYMTDDVVKTMAGSQTLPLFTLFGNIIHYTNNQGNYIFKHIDLDEAKIDNAISNLELYTVQTIEKFRSGDQVANDEPSTPDIKRVLGGDNVIYYGAPGTGKTWTVDRVARVSGTGTLVRTVFHPDTQNSDFIGSLKPSVSEDGDITYRFSPGSFASALVNATMNPGDMHWLVIEELNRAPAAAVFGELFLLLDRYSDGRGKYDADFPSEEFCKWWQSRTGLACTRMRLPSNLSIYATMNSADQGVFPLDTAFRRRWKQIYVPIDYANAPEGEIAIANANGETKSFAWKEFAEKLNRFLISEIGSGISEDRLVGHRFLSEDDLAGEKGIPGKLLIYLWDDLLRHHGREILFRKEIRTYGNLAAYSTNSRQIFSGKFLAALQPEMTDDE